MILIPSINPHSLEIDYDNMIHTCIYRLQNDGSNSIFYFCKDNPYINLSTMNRIKGLHFSIENILMKTQIMYT